MSKEKAMISLDGPYMEMLSLKYQGYCCSQIVAKLVLDRAGRENAELVRAMAALCFGTGGICGILTGAACTLSAALPGTGELPDTLLPLLLDELKGWFTLRAENAYGGTSCEKILETSPDKRACSELLIATVEKLQSMLQANSPLDEPGRP